MQQPFPQAWTFGVIFIIRGLFVVQIFIGMKCLVKGRFIHRNIAVLTNKNFVYTAKSAAHMFPAGDCNGSVHCHHQNRGRCQRVAECRRTEMCHIHQQRLRESGQYSRRCQRAALRRGRSAREAGTADRCSPTIGHGSVFPVPRRSDIPQRSLNTWKSGSTAVDVQSIPAAGSCQERLRRKSDRQAP